MVCPLHVGFCYWGSNLHESDVFPFKHHVISCWVASWCILLYSPSSLWKGVGENISTVLLIAVYITVLNRRIFVGHSGTADDQPKLEIDRKLLQYRRYETSYPNSTCKEHCDAKKGLVPYSQVRISICYGYSIGIYGYWASSGRAYPGEYDDEGERIDRPTFSSPSTCFRSLEQQQLLSRLQEMRTPWMDYWRTLHGVSPRQDAIREPNPVLRLGRADNWLQKSLGRWSHGIRFVR